MVAKVAGYEPRFQNLPAEPSGVDYRVGDPTLMNTFYTPKISLSEGIQRAFAGLS